MQVANKSPIVMSSRGAKFLDLVRQNRINVSPQLTIKANRRFSLNDAMKKTPMNEVKKPEYLHFSSEVKFNPDASPSSGILSKRKAENESPLLNSSAKRKRVGFRDPVSSTKEYLITAEEEKHKKNESSLIRCLIYNEEDFGDDEEETGIQQQPLVVKEVVPIGMEVEIKSENTEVNEEPQNTDITTTDTEQMKTNNLLSFKDQDEILNYVKNNFSVDEVLKVYTEDQVERKSVMKKVTEQVELSELIDEYFPEENKENLTDDQNKFVYGIIGHLSKLMKSNLRVKHKMMDILAEKHSDEFLDHALQENSISHVCDKITIPKIVEFLIHRANVCANDDYDTIYDQMNKKILYHLVDATSTREIIENRQELHQLLSLVFKNKKKIEIFDTAHEFLRNLV